jgi:hypothetical protein
MREEIRLGNEALARNDFETAKQYFQQILVTDGTPMQKLRYALSVPQVHRGQVGRVRGGKRPRVILSRIASSVPLINRS